MKLEQNVFLWQTAGNKVPKDETEFKIRILLSCL